MLEYGIRNQNNKNIGKRLLAEIILKVSCLYSRMLERRAERRVPKEKNMGIGAEDMVKKIEKNHLWYLDKETDI